MTAWCNRTTSVRKVRARSSEALRAFVLGAARMSAAVAEGGIDVMTLGQAIRVGCCRGGEDSARSNCRRERKKAGNRSRHRKLEEGIRQAPRRASWSKNCDTSEMGAAFLRDL